MKLWMVEYLYDDGKYRIQQDFVGETQRDVQILWAKRYGWSPDSDTHARTVQVNIRRVKRKRDQK